MRSTGMLSDEFFTEMGNEFARVWSECLYINACLDALVRRGVKMALIHSFYV